MKCEESRSAGLSLPTPFVDPELLQFALRGECQPAQRAKSPGRWQRFWQRAGVPLVLALLIAALFAGTATPSAAFMEMPR